MGVFLWLDCSTQAMSSKSKFYWVVMSQRGPYLHMLIYKSTGSTHFTLYNTKPNKINPSMVVHHELQLRLVLVFGYILHV